MKRAVTTLTAVTFVLLGGKTLRHILSQKRASIALKSVGAGMVAVFSVLAVSEQNALIPAVDRATRLGTQQAELFNNFNPSGTLNGPRNQTMFKLDRQTRITALMTYHWNSGRGAQPGTIGLRDQKGKVYGPFAASGSSGYGGAPNVNWIALTDITVPAGTYTVLDSNSETWSNNADSGFAGFAKVMGQPAEWDPKTFVGRWVGKGYTCRGSEPDEIIEITYSESKRLNATKLKGDDCVRSGELTWRNGMIAGDSIRTEFHVRALGGAQSDDSWLAGSINIVSHDELRGFGVTWTRSLSDLIVNTFGIEPYDGKDVNGNPKNAWRVRAEVKNVGSGLAMERFRVELGRRSRFDASEYAIADSRTYLQRLHPGDTVVIEWDTSRQTDQTSPPNITKDDTEIWIKVDTDNVVLETSEDNNQATVVRLDCAGPDQTANSLDTMWVEKFRQSSGFADYYPLISKFNNPQDAVLCYIRLEAKRRARNDVASALVSDFLFQLENYFLKEYLENPTKETGLSAIDRIGKPQGFPRVGLGAAMYVPEGIRRLHLDARNLGVWEWLYPANQFWNRPIKGDYVNIIPYLDVPFLVGLPNKRPGENDDAIYGGKNLSNVMHWATGLKYHMVPPDLMHDLFVGYEYWHMEGFDVFGEDSLNDLIGEEAGRLMGREIAAAQIRSKQDLRRTVDRSFREARAWVGALVRFRQKDLDRLILSYNPPKTHQWMQRYETVEPWAQATIGRRLSTGQGIEEITRSPFVNQLVDIYALIYFADEWEIQNGNIRLTPITQKILEGKYSSQFKAANKSWTDKWEWIP